MTAQLACEALTMELFRLGLPKNVIVHREIGSQYCSNSYLDLIEQYQFIQCMSRNACSWDNAYTESFFHSLKHEPIMDRETIRQTVFKYIEVDYNKTKRHSSLGYLSPEKFELKNSA